MVGTMMASEVPMHICMRTSSGTVERAEHFVKHRNDDRAASDPEQTGENTDDDAGAGDQKREPGQLADRIPQQHQSPRHEAERSGGDVRQIGSRVQHQRERISHDSSGCSGLDSFGREMAAEGARAGNTTEQAEHVAGD